MSSLATTSSISCSTNGISSGNRFRQTSGVAGHVGANGLPPESGSTAASAVTLEVDDASVAAPSVWDFELRAHPEDWYSTGGQKLEVLVVQPNVQTVECHQGLVSPYQDPGEGCSHLQGNP